MSADLPALLVVPGPPATKKTCQRVVRVGPRVRILPSVRTLAWEHEAILRFRAAWRGRAPLAGPVRLEVRVCLPDRRRADLTGYLQAACDSLVRAGVLADDRWSVVASFDGSRVEVSPREPRLEVRIHAHPTLPLVLVGQAPGPKAASPLASVGLRRLARWADLDFDAVFWGTERHNLLPTWPGRARSGPGDRFPLAEARRAASSLAPRLEGRTVVLLGAGVARAFGLLPAPFRWHARPGRAALVLPHPSGVSHSWNDPAVRARAGGALHALLGSHLIGDKVGQTSGQVGETALGPEKSPSLAPKFSPDSRSPVVPISGDLTDLCGLSTSPHPRRRRRKYN